MSNLDRGLVARFRRATLILVVLAGVAGGAAAVPRQDPQPTPPAPAAPQTLPGGATQIQETHGDWRVTCAQPGGQKLCTLSQQLADKDSRQLVMGLELKTTTALTAEGNLVLPFGLAVDKAVTLQVDQGSLITARIRTCLPVGCIANLALDGPAIEVMRKGTVLTVNAVADGGQDVPFKLSLAGFTSALERTAALSK